VSKEQLKRAKSKNLLMCFKKKRKRN